MNQKRLKTSVKLIFKPQPASPEKGELFFQIIRRRDVRLVSTGFVVHRAEWNQRTGIEQPTATPEREEILAEMRESLRSDELLFEEVVNSLDGLASDYGADEVAALFNERKSRGDIGRFVDCLVGELRQANRVRTAEIYRSALRSFKHFCGGRSVRLDEVSDTLMTSYVTYLERRGLMRNTISFYLRTLHAIYVKAVGRNLTADRHPFKNLRHGVEKTVKRAIPASVVRSIRDLNLPVGSHLARSRDLFLFSFYTRGMAFVDMAYLRASDLNGGYICYHRRKTGQRLVVHYESCMRDIVQRYSVADMPYLLPIITHLGNERRQYLSALRETNRQLKRIAEMVGFGGTLSIYVARHTWASMAKNKHIPVSVISEGMGHNSERTTRIYLASLDNAVIDRANRVVLESIRDEK